MLLAKRLNLSYLILVFLSVGGSVLAQTSQSGETPPIQPTATEVPRLPVSNPFFLPYARDFQLSFQGAAMQSRVRTDMPAQNAIGLFFPAIYSETTASNYSASLAIRYGFFDRFGAGISTDYFIPGSSATTKTGTSTTFASLSAADGFTGPEFSLYGRFAGTRPGQFYLDAMLAARPGFASSTTNATGPGRTSTTGTLATGFNFRYFTLGVAASYFIAPSTSVTSTTKGSGPYGSTTSTTISAPGVSILAGMALLHAEVAFFYLRGSVGYAKNTVADDSMGSLGKIPYWTYGASAGFKFSAATMLDFSWFTSPEIRGDEYYTGYSGAFRQYVTSGPSSKYTVTFSMKI